MFNILKHNVDYTIEDRLGNIVFIGKYAGCYVINSSGTLYEIMNFYSNNRKQYELLAIHYLKGFYIIKERKGL